MNDNSHQKYINEMEKNSKLFEEKMNKFKKYQKSSIYNEPDNFLEEEDFETNKYTTIKKLHKLENKEDSDEEGNNYGLYKSKEIISNNPSKNLKSKYRKRDFEDENILDYNYEYENPNKYQNKKKFNKNNKYKDDIKEYNNKYDIEEEFNDPKIKIVGGDRLIKNKREDNFGSETKEKQNIQSKKEFDDLHYSHEKISNELDEKIKQVKNQEEEIKNLKFKLENIFEHNKDLKNEIKKKNDELDNLKVSLDTIKDEIKVSKNKYNDVITKHKQLIQDYDNLNKDYTSLKIEKENLNSIIEEQRAELFNAKKEITELKKTISKLNNGKPLAFSSMNNDYEENEYNNKYQRNNIYKNENPPKYNKNNDYDYNELKYEENKKKNSIKNNRNKYKNIDNYENEIPSQNYNKDYKNRDLNYYESKKEEKQKNKYNDYNEEDYDYDKENNQEKQRFNNNIVSKYNYKYRKNNSNEDEDYNNNDNDNFIFGNNNINREHHKEEIKMAKKEDEYTTIITEKDKIIGCDKEKMQTLINNREYQIVEKELSILIKEKNRLEGSLLKMPEHPRKLNDIRSKKEINDLIERIESDISFTRTMLKRTNDYYIKKI